MDTATVKDYVVDSTKSFPIDADTYELLCEEIVMKNTVGDSYG